MMVLSRSSRPAQEKKKIQTHYFKDFRLKSEKKNYEYEDQNSLFCEDFLYSVGTSAF